MSKSDISFFYISLYIITFLSFIDIKTKTKGCIAKLDATFVVYTDIYFLFHDTVATHEGVD